MKPTGRIAGAVIILFLISMAVLPILSEKLVTEAQAFRGRGAAFVVGAAVGSASSSSAEASAAASQQQAAAAPQQPAVQAGKALPLGTVVSALPGGCVPTPSGGVNYYYCDGNFYQAAYQGSSLVYVTTKPK